MLRLTEMEASPNRVTLIVEGRIVSRSLTMLEDECRRCLKSGRSLTLDLSRVTHAGPPAVDLLRRLNREGAQLTRVRPLLRDLLGGGT